jgi:hypothetical protein
VSLCVFVPAACLLLQLVSDAYVSQKRYLGKCDVRLTHGCHVDDVSLAGIDIATHMVGSACLRCEVDQGSMAM